jgi:ATP-dependent protease ClpP protease subunit
MNRYNLQARGTRAELRIYGDIGQNWDAEESNDAKSVVEALDGLAGDLDVRINSFGGSVADGLAIYNALSRYPGKVTAHVEGAAYSIASLIAMAANEVRIAKNAMLMIHAPWGFAMGNAPEMREMAEILDKHAEAMLTSYLRNGGPDEATLRGWLTDGKDHYFNASEAIAIGLADGLSDFSPLMDIAASLRAGGYRSPAAQAAQPETRPNTMANETQAATEAAENLDIVAKHSRTIKTATAAGVKAEATRRKQITDVFADFYDADPLNPISALHDACMDDTQCDELGARRKLLAYLAGQSEQPIVAREQYAMEPQPSAPPRASRHLGGAMLAGRDQIDKRVQGLTTALKIKAGVETDRKVIDQERQGEYLAMSLTDIMAGEMRAAGYPVNGTREDIARNYMRHVLAAGPSHGTDHLPAVLGNIANLSAMQGWGSSEETWGQWTQQGTLSNYQTHTRANIALLDKLTKMAENQEWEYGDMADIKQRITGFFYGLKYSLSIQAIVNDDLGELARTMNGWGEAAAATVGDAVYAVLTTAGSGGLGQVMDEDSKVLFHADHTNYVASGSGAVPDETTLNTARAAMVAKNDPNGRKVAVRPRFILHGPGIYSTVYKLLNSQSMITGSTTTQPESNSVPSMGLQPVEEYRFTGKQWLLSAARRTVEVAGVGGPVSPRAEQSPISNVPGLTYELSMPFGVAALDYRGLYYNHGE